MIHTPTPWKISNSSDIRGADNFLVGMTNPIGSFTELSRENRKFIIRACNSHDEMLAALKQVASFFDGSENHGCLEHRMIYDAIALSEGSI